MVHSDDDKLQIPWVPVLMYHRIVPRPPARDPYQNCVTTSAFESHLRWFARRGYRSMTLSELTRSAVHDRGQRGLRMAITFDDGYEDNLVHAAPLLRRYGFTATIYVVTDAIGSVNHFDSEMGADQARMLSRDQIVLLADLGMEIGSHSCSHPASLPQLSDADLLNQLQRSKQVLEEITRRPVLSFSYPHGQVSWRAEAAVAASGYESACAGVGIPFRPYRLSRVATSVSWGPLLETTVRWRGLKHEVARRLPARAQGEPIPGRSHEANLPFA